MSRNIIISGGARGIGRALARYLLEAGNRVYIMDIDEQELQHTTQVHLGKYHKEGKLESSICNLRDVQDIRKKVETAAKFFDGRIHVLVNNGGIASPKWKDDATMEDPATMEQWQAYIETNLTAPFAMSQACIPYMKTTAVDNEDTGAQKMKGSGPCIINIGSFRAYQSDPNQEGYASSKAGLVGLTQAMSISLGHLGIRVNLIAPGRIKVAHESKEGDEQETTFHEQVSEKDVSDHPTNRAGRPKDIADAVMYFMDAGFVTGVSSTPSLSGAMIDLPIARSCYRWWCSGQKVSGGVSKGVRPHTRYDERRIIVIDTNKRNNVKLCNSRPAGARSVIQVTVRPRTLFCREGRGGCHDLGMARWIRSAEAGVV
jgi:NAD(P)-dependent dehydrogenase (short-subunit alcohol dehydrogenase family)